MKENILALVACRSPRISAACLLVLVPGVVLGVSSWCWFFALVSGVDQKIRRLTTVFSITSAHRSANK